MKTNRRGVLGLLGAGVIPLPSLAEPAPPTATFAYGVASGDPDPGGVLLWTKLLVDVTLAPASFQVAWEVAADPAFARIVAHGMAPASIAADYTVKADVRGLRPGRDYWYRFKTGTTISQIGRTRTLPIGHVRDVVFAVATCALYPNGFFNAYQAIADLPRVDAVLHLGDYIYEYGAQPSAYGMQNGLRLGRIPDPPHEVVTLDDYRRRYAQARRESALQAAHARAAFICIWDDHESANNSWMDGAENQQPDEGTWSERKAAAVRAWYEWMPIRDPAPGQNGWAINRAFQFGDLATLMMTESRLIGRTQQLDYSVDLPPGSSDEQVAAFRGRLADPARQLLGATQEAWLARTMAASVRAGRVWQVLGNQVVMGKIRAYDLPAIMGATYEAMATALPALRRQAENQRRLSQLGLPGNLDSWDGYPTARDRFFAAARRARAHPIVLSGDSHAFWANELWDQSQTSRVAAEFGATSITSPGSADRIPGLPMAQHVIDANREVIFTNLSAKGFLLLTLTRWSAKAQMIAVSTIESLTFETRVLKTFEVGPTHGGGVGPITEG